MSYDPADYHCFSFFSATLDAEVEVAMEVFDDEPHHMHANSDMDLVTVTLGACELGPHLSTEAFDKVQDEARAYVASH